MNKLLIIIIVIIVLLSVILIIQLVSKKFLKPKRDENSQKTNGIQNNIKEIEVHNIIKDNTNKTTMKNKLLPYNEKFRYNIYKTIGVKTERSSSEIFSSLIKNTILVEKLQSTFGVGNIIWEITKDIEGNFDYELYFYGLQKSSNDFQQKWSLYEENENYIEKFLNIMDLPNGISKKDGLCIYSYKLSDETLKLFYVHEQELSLPLQITEEINNKEVGVRRVFCVNCGHTLISQAQWAGLENHETLIVEETIKNYVYDNAIVFKNTTRKQFGIVLNGINNEQFSNFLKENNYPKDLIFMSLSDDYDLENEISFYFQDGILIKTGIFGIL